MTDAPDFEEIYRRLEAVAPEELAAELRHPIGQAESVLANAEAPVAAHERAALSLRRAGWCMDALEKGDAASAVYHAVRLCQAAHDAAYMETVEPQFPHEPLFTQRLRGGLRAMTGHRRKGESRRRATAARYAEIAAYVAAKRRESAYLSLADVCRLAEKRFNADARTVRRAVASAKKSDN